MTAHTSEQRPVYILAGTYQQALDASRSIPEQRWRYVDEPRYLFGIRGGQMIVAGTFWERRDASELYDRARAAGLEPVQSTDSESDRVSNPTETSPDRAPNE